MSTPTPGVEGAAAADTDMAGTTDIPRRLMRVKVLYTFDDQNKSNCLARLPTALSIPTVSLDETTQVGVIELKTCIQAIVSASPELVAKLGHDYTVYAYDFSEYETPLVGQGMLSWILASASTTPNAPAEESQTMVTGRVCKNILGLFANGIKETLEVKLKLVPVPTCMQSEYVENMERYHSLSKMMPEGMDYREWADFLKANPAIGQLAQPTPKPGPPILESMTPTAIESFNELMMNHSSYGQRHLSFGAYDTRPSSPAMSMASFHSYQPHPEFRPASQASFHSDSAMHSPYRPPTADHNVEQQEEGRPKKRARVTKAKRPKKTALGTKDEPLRVTASTAASVRLHRPTPANASASVSAEQVPRAPTPRPHYAGVLANVPRVPAPSLLRNASTDESRSSYVSPYTHDSGIFSDNAVESADDDKGDSPSETPPNMPSSPPMLSAHVASPVPSSPELPMLPPPHDSGFASDMPVAHNEEGSEQGGKPSERGDASTVPEVRTRKKRDNSKRPWSEINPGPSGNFLPAPETRNRPGPRGREPGPAPIDTGLLKHFLDHMETIDPQQGISMSIETPVARAGVAPLENTPSNIMAQNCQVGPSPSADGMTIGSMFSQPKVIRLGTPSNSLPIPKAPRGLARSQTWSGEPASDAAGPDDGKGKQPRSGSGARRQTKQIIKERLEVALEQGKLPTFCNNCGQIETPAWRKAYTLVEAGIPNNIELSSKGTAIVAYETMDPATNKGEPHYRIFKNELTDEEKEAQIFTTLTLCNPCGLWLLKKKAMRPQEVWGKSRTLGSTQGSADKPKRSRKTEGPRFDNDLLTSDAVIPESETGFMDIRTDTEGLQLDGVVDGQMPPPSQMRPENAGHSKDSQLDAPTARAALERAFQSSPVGVRGSSRDTAIALDGDLTPTPTRRLLFPSPRRPGEMKSLSDIAASQSHAPRSTPSKTSKVTPQTFDVAKEDGDKENCPPPAETEDDDLAHLFESPKRTPTQGSSLEDLLKTPTPSSRWRVPLTPMRHAEVNLTTPSRSSRTPRGSGRAATLAPETPFTRQLNDLLSASMNAGSPSQTFDISAFPTFNTPGSNSLLQFGDFLQNDSLSSDLPMPSSSPPKNFDFPVFEDPSTSTVGLWSGESIFDINEAIMSEAPQDDQQSGAPDGTATPKILTINGISLDFSAVIEEVVGHADSEQQETKPDTPVPAAPAVESPPTTAELAAPEKPHPTTTELAALVESQSTSNESAAFIKSRATTAGPVAPLRSRPDLIPVPAPKQSNLEVNTMRPCCQRCKQKKKGCDRAQPCGRCVKANLGDECIPVNKDATSTPATSPAFSHGAETPRYSDHVQEQIPPPVRRPSIPVDPALLATTALSAAKAQVTPPAPVSEANEAVSKMASVSGNAATQASSPSTVQGDTAPASTEESKQGAIPPNTAGSASETAQAAEQTATAAAPTPEVSKTP